MKSTPNVNVVADYDMVAVIVRNLLSNAIKFSPPYATVDVEFMIIEQLVHAGVH